MADWKSDSKQYRESGSYRFSAEQRESYALILDVKVISYVGSLSFSTKANPEYGFWGNATVFEGTTLSKRIPTEFPRFRLLNVKNDAVAATYNALAIAADANEQITGLGELVEHIWNRFSDIRLTPALRHDETVVKFKCLPLSQFEFSCYWLEFPDNDLGYPDFNDDAPPGDDDEYYMPEQNGVDDPYNGNPLPDPPDPDSDPRDFGDDNEPGPGFIGVLSYEFRDQNSGAFQPNSIAGIKWPGQLFATISQGFNAVAWRDDEGTETVMVIGAAPPVQVRFVQIATDDGQIFVPDPNEFSAP